MCWSYKIINQEAESKIGDWFRYVLLYNRHHHELNKLTKGSKNRAQKCMTKTKVIISKCKRMSEGRNKIRTDSHPVLMMMMIGEALAPD